MRLLTLGAWLGACAVAGAVAGLVLLAVRCLLDVVRSRVGRVVAGALVAMVLAGTAAGQEEERGASRLSASAWCPVWTSSEGRRQVPADALTEGEGEGEQAGGADQEQDHPGEVECDGGLGLGLIGRDFSQGRLSLVAVVGSKSIGAGLAWTLRGEWDHPVSVAVGLVAPYDSGGVYLDGAAVAVGATVGLGRR